MPILNFNTALFLFAGGFAIILNHGEQTLHGVVDVLVGGSGNENRSFLQALFEFGQLLLQVLVTDGIDFVESDDLRLSFKLGAVFFQLIANNAVGLHRVIACHIDEMEQNGATFNMAQKARAEPHTFVGAFNEAWNISQHKTVSRCFHHAQLGVQGGEGIIGDFWLGG